jgi:polar amino acid transport system substrate-binding protein
MTVLRTLTNLTLLCASIVFGSSYALAACEPEKAPQKYPESSKKTIQIATPTTTPPFAFSNPENLEQMMGLEIEMIEFAMRCAGLKFQYVKGPFSALIQSTMSGSTDLMIGNVNYLPERAKRVDFIAYLRSGQSVIVAKGNPKNLISLESLCGMTASSTVGGASGAEIERRSADCVKLGKRPINYTPSVDQEAAVRQLSNTRIDFVMDGSISAKKRVAVHPTELDLGFTILTDLVIGPAVRKDNAEMRQAVLEGLQVLEQEGKLKALLVKYDLSEFARPVELRR